MLPTDVVRKRARSIPTPEVLLAMIGVALLLFILWSMSELARVSPEVKRTQLALRHLADLRARAGDVETAGRGYLLTKDRWYLEPARLSIATIDDDIRVLEGVLAGTAFEDRFEALAQLIRASVDKSRLLIAIRDRDGLAAALRALRSGDEHRLMEEIRARAAALQTELRSFLTRDRALRDETVDRLITGAIGSTIVLCFVLPLSVRGVRERRALRHVRQTYARLRQSSLGTALWDAHGYLVDANDEYLRIFGRTPGALAEPLHWADLLGPGYGKIASAGALELSTTGVCKPFLLFRAKTASDRGAATALVWSVVADEEQQLVASCAVEASSTLVDEADARATFSPLAASVKAPSPGAPSPVLLEDAPAV